MPPRRAAWLAASYILPLCHCSRLAERARPDTHNERPLAARAARSVVRAVTERHARCRAALPSIILARGARSRRRRRIAAAWYYRIAMSEPPKCAAVRPSRFTTSTDGTRHEQSEGVPGTEVSTARIGWRSWPAARMSCDRNTSPVATWGRSEKVCATRLPAASRKNLPRRIHKGPRDPATGMILGQQLISTKFKMEVCPLGQANHAEPGELPLRSRAGVPSTEGRDQSNAAGYHRCPASSSCDSLLSHFSSPHVVSWCSEPVNRFFEVIRAATPARRPASADSAVRTGCRSRRAARHVAPSPCSRRRYEVSACCQRGRSADNERVVEEQGTNAACKEGDCDDSRHLAHAPADATGGSASDNVDPRAVRGDDSRRGLRPELPQRASGT